MIEPKDVTIIIPHLGGEKEPEYALDQCWQSLEETAKDIKKIVVINGRKCDVPHHHEISTIMVKDQGQCKAVNAAVANCDTPWIMVTNDDMVYAPGWFEELTVFDNGVKVNGGELVWDVKCISPKLVEPRQGAPTFEMHFCGGAGGDFDKQKFLDYAESRESMGVVSTGFNLPFLIRRDLWNTVGGYDINYDPWGSNSDSDLEYKIRLAGVQPYQSQRAVVYHFSQTSGTFSPAHQDAWGKNWQYFIDKWGFPRTDNGIWEANFHLPSVEEGRIFKPSWENKYAV